MEPWCLACTHSWAIIRKLMGYLQNFKFEIHGDDSKPKMVFLHGLMGSGVNWRKIVSQLKADFQILIFDQRGHGRSFKPESGYTPEDYSIDLKLILDELGWRKLHLIGHSMGGRNALRFAFKYPGYLSSLVIEDIGPEGNPEAMERTLKLLDLVPAPFPDKATAKSFFDNDFPELVKNHPQRKIIGPYLYTNIEEKEDGLADWRFYKDGILDSLKLGHFQERWEEVESIKCPCLWIRGELSEDLTQAEFEKIQRNPSIEAVEISGAGHWVHFDKPAEFIQVLKTFYSKLSSL